ncbi:hypothetical protein REPUB_Repub19eG0111800 [Reevesia pubescens]
MKISTQHRSDKDKGIVGDVVFSKGDAPFIVACGFLFILSIANDHLASYLLELAIHFHAIVFDAFTKTTSRTLQAVIYHI